jgi:hypothetical protein
LTNPKLQETKNSACATAKAEGGTRLEGREAKKLLAIKK